MFGINRIDFAADKSDKAVSPNEILNIRCVRATSGYHFFVLSEDSIRTLCFIPGKLHSQLQLDLFQRCNWLPSLLKCVQVYVSRFVNSSVRSNCLILRIIRISRKIFQKVLCTNCFNL